MTNVTKKKLFLFFWLLIFKYYRHTKYFNSLRFWTSVTSTSSCCTSSSSVYCIFLCQNFSIFYKVNSLLHCTMWPLQSNHTYIYGVCIYIRYNKNITSIWIESWSKARFACLQSHHRCFNKQNPTTPSFYIEKKK